MICACFCILIKVSSHTLWLATCVHTQTPIFLLLFYQGTTSSWMLMLLVFLLRTCVWLSRHDVVSFPPPLC